METENNVNPSGNEIINEPQKINRKGSLPQSDIDTISVAESVVENWNESEVKLRWITKTAFLTLITEYKESLNSRIQASTTRNPNTQKATELDKKIDAEIEYVKAYIAEKYGKQNAVAYYSQFGIVKGQSYKLPKNRESRLQSLNQLIEAITTHSLQTMQYGLDYWTNIRNEYSELITILKNAAGNISLHAGNKKHHKEDTRKILNSIILGIKANYPDDYKAILRSWGFQKEKY